MAIVAGYFYFKILFPHVLAFSLKLHIYSPFAPARGLTPYVQGFTGVYGWKIAPEGRSAFSETPTKNAPLQDLRTSMLLLHRA